MKKIIVFVILILLTVPNFVKAETLNDMYNKLAKLQTEYNNNKNNKELTQAQINKINSEINKINGSITIIRADIKQAEADIEKSKDEIEDKKVETDGLIRFLQLSNGGNIYLEYLFDADSYTEFIYRYEVVKQLTNYNSDLIDELEQLILDLQEKEKNLEAKNVQLEKERDDLSSNLITLQTGMKNYNVEGTNLATDIEKLKELIQLYENMGCSRYEDVTSCSSMVNATGWSYPLAKGCVTSEYTGSNERNDWKGGSHYGIDLGCAVEGTKVYAAATGIVSSIVKEWECGGNIVYVQHIVNGKKYTTAYMHLLRFASGLKVGSAVTPSTVIGYVGGYSTSSDRGGYDDCTSGAHLHFGMAEGHHPPGFNSYAFNPREIFAFPKLSRYGGGYFYR